MNLRLCFIDDDEESQELWLDYFDNPNWNCVCKDNALDANDIAADVYVIDVTSVSSDFQPLQAAFPVLTLAENHPGSVFIIISAMSKNTVMEIIEMIQEQMPDVVVKYGGSSDFDGIEAALKEIFGQDVIGATILTERGEW